MTPAEKSVIRWAKCWAHAEGRDAVEDAAEALQDAITALESETLPDSAAEKRCPWSEVVTEDEIYSTKTKKWYRVVSTVAAADNGRAYVKVQCEGMAKPFTVPAYAAVLVRRSEMGQAVDVWIDVMRSGPE